jgi:hypothetical protein
MKGKTMALAALKRFMSPLVFAVVSAFLVWRLFHLIDYFSVNLPIWDQFSFYFLLSSSANKWYAHAAQQSWWGLFDRQFGPHRLGVGLVVSKYLSRLTHWNFRAETFLIGTLVSGAMVVAAAVKRRLFGPIAWHDAAIPLIMLTAGQYDIWAGTPDSSHGAFPLFFVMLYCLAWTMRWRPARYGLVLIINFLAIFTGFGLFLGCVTILVFTIRLARALVLRRWNETLGSLGMLAIAIASMGLFFFRYTLNSANPTFRFPDPNWPLYPHYMAIALARAGGFVGKSRSGRHIADIIGWMLLIACVAAVLVHWRRAASQDDPKWPRSLVILALLTFTLFFAADMVVGRISMGREMIESSRYVPLMMPGLVGLYFAALAIERSAPRVAAVGAVLILACYSGMRVKSDDLHAMSLTTAGKITWVETYLKTGQLDAAARASAAVDPQFTIHPAPAEAKVPAKLRFLRDNKLSFFYTNRPQ